MPHSAPAGPRLITGPGCDACHISPFLFFFVCVDIKITTSQYYSPPGHITGLFLARLFVLSRSSSFKCRCKHSVDFLVPSHHLLNGFPFESFYISYFPVLSLISLLSSRMGNHCMFLSLFYMRFNCADCPLHKVLACYFTPDSQYASNNSV